ncbi:MAG: phospholipase D-like domain-containing protein [Candidatus Hodarchaeales archaeon]|jgi:phosphatidylserine/phosphatidylglycerophosphate/cardiolipin synthase-like enzyme
MKKKAVLLITLAILSISILVKGDQNLLISDQLIFNEIRDYRVKIIDTKGITKYTPKFDAMNIKETMTLSPMFTPDNALDIHKWWIDRANVSIDIQNQYIKKFDSGMWFTSADSNPIVRGIVEANQTRNVAVRVQVREDSDSDNVTDYLLDEGIDVRWMGDSNSNPDDEWLSNTHNKLVIIDNKVVLISSINFGYNAFANNREAGMVIQSETAAQHFTQIFVSDWIDGEKPPTPLASKPSSPKKPTKISKIASDYTSHTNIPRTNFTGTYNITLFTNPDNAYELIFHYLESAKESIYVSMYTISRPDFNKTLIDLKKANPAIDIQVLISNRRVGGSENVDTKAAAESLVANLIPVYNSTKLDTAVNNFYHNKYWIIDGKHVFVYSGNWSPRSVTELEEGETYFTSTEANRDMGVAIHDAPNIAQFYKDVWDADIAVGSAWELPVGIKQTSFSKAEVINGEVTLSAQVSGLTNPEVSYRWGNGDYTTTTLTGDSFSETFDTWTLPNGITSFEVKAVNGSQTFTDEVTVNVVNHAPSENWRVLITEALPDPSEVPDAEGEFIELTNSFPFAVLIEGWKIGDDNDLYTFPLDYQIDAYTSIIIARDATGFEGAYSTTADIELSVSLKNSDDFIQFLNAEGDYIDVVAYGSTIAPDGSESLSAPDAGESILRTPLHVDTDTAKDFIVGDPDPKGTIPHESLSTDPGDTGTSSTDASFSWIAFVLAIVILPIIRRKRRN